MRKSLKYFAIAAMIAALPLHGALVWQGKNIPAGVKDNGASVVKAARMENFNILAGTVDSPEISAAFKKHFPGKALKDDGFFLVIDRKNIIAGSLKARGLVYAITHAAEILNAYTPARPNGQDDLLPGKAKTDVRYKICTNPAFAYRGFTVCLFNNIHTTFAHWLLRNGCNEAFAALRMTADYYDAMTNFGMPWNTVGHSFYYWLPGKYHKTDPEYFPIINGKPKIYRGDYATQIQLNVANKGLQDLVVKNILEYLKKYPESEAISLGMNDGSGWGNSPAERAFDDPEEYKQGKYSTRYFRFVNLIAERVSKVHPKVKLVALAYLHCVEPPKLEKLHPNLIIKICTYRRCYKCRINDPACTVNRIWDRRLRAWAKYGNQIVVHDYLNLGGLPEFPVPMLKVIQQDLQYYRTLGVNWFRSEIVVDGGPLILAAPNFRGKGFYRTNPKDHDRHWTGANITFHLLGKLMWNPYADLETLIAAYFRNYYGAAGKDMAQIYALIGKRWQEDAAPYVWSSYYTNFPAMLFRRGDRDVIEKHLQAAEKAVAATPYYRKRVAKMAKLIRELWFRQMGAKGKELKILNGKAVIDGGFVARSPKGPEPSKFRSRVELELRGDILCVKGEFFQSRKTMKIRNPGRDVDIDHGDTFEIFIDAGPAKRKDGSYQFIITSGGSLWDGQLRNSKWNSNTKVRTEIKADRWIAYAEIPLKELGYDNIKKGDRIRANFVVIRRIPKTDISGWNSAAVEGRSALGELVIE